MPGTLQLVQVGKNPVRIQSLLVPNDTFMLVNPDITNNIFIGNDQSSQLIAVPALGSVTLDPSKHDIWVSTNGGNYTVSAYLMPNGSNWVPSPAQVATQINALGLAKDTTVNAVKTTLGAPAQTTDINAVKTTLGTPAQTADVANVNTTLSLGTNPNIQALGGAANRSIAQDMLNANHGTTTEIAALIASGNAAGTPGGVPLLRGTTQLGNANGATLAASSTVTLFTANITSPSFEAVFKLNLPAGAGTKPFALLGVGWQDQATGLQVGFKQYALTCGNGPTNALTYYLSGPCRGNQLVLTLQNLDTVQTLTYSYLFNTISHVYLIDRLLQPLYATGASPIGWTNPGGNPAMGTLAMTAPSIGPNGNIIRLVAASNAKCKLNVDDSGQANPWALVVQDPQGLYGDASGTQPIYKFNGVAGSVQETEIQMPNGPVALVMFNTAATNTITLGVTITIMEY